MIEVQANEEVAMTSTDRKRTPGELMRNLRWRTGPRSRGALPGSPPGAGGRLLELRPRPPL